VSRAVGDQAERRAAAFLERHGFRILERNYVCKGGEIDLVCDDAGTLVFVEVRARASDRYGGAAATVRHDKQRHVVHAARHYLVARKVGDVACRFDVVAIEGDHVEHYKDAFDAS
jgi:putative endonuclease